MIRNIILTLLGSTAVLGWGLTAFTLWVGKSANVSLSEARDQLEIRVEERTRSLAESEERTRRLLASVGEGVFGVDTSGVIMFVNPQCMNDLGYSEDELLGTKAHALFHHHRADGSDYPVEECWMYKSFTEGNSYRIDDEVLWRKDGTPFLVEYSAAPMVRGGVIIGSVVSFRDITERKEAEAKLADAYDVIASSIEYASHIQRSVLPEAKALEQLMTDHFVWWEPRDRVGGDAYWCERWGRGRLLALGDCTGHGVPGAFMTMITNGALDMALMETPPGDVAFLLQRTHQLIQSALGQDHTGGESDDGLEMGICYIESGAEKMVFAGAGFSLFHVDDGAVSEIRGDKGGLGYRGIPRNADFTNRDVALAPGRAFYMTSDGLIDQIGGPKRRSFGKRRFRDLLARIAAEPMAA